MARVLSVVRNRVGKDSVQPESGSCRLNVRNAGVPRFDCSRHRISMLHSQIERSDRAHLSSGQTGVVHNHLDQPRSNATITTIERLTVPGLEPPVDAVIVKGVIANSPSNGAAACLPCHGLVIIRHITSFADRYRDLLSSEAFT